MRMAEARRRGRHWLRRSDLLLRLAILTAPGRHYLARVAALLRSMTARDLAARYRGSLLGAAWAILTPFAMMALYTVVFSVFLKGQLSTDPSPVAFALYLLAGLLPWTAFAESTSRATTVILEQQNLVKKVVFPLEVIPLSIVGSALVTHLVALALFLLIVLALHGWAATILLLPLLLIPLALLASGVGLFLASLGVFLRDISQAIGLILTAWLFLTPIMYQRAAVPSSFQPVIGANPFTLLVTAYRQVIFEGQVPSATTFVLLYVIAGIIFGAGWWWFGRTKAAFADVL